MEIISAIVDSAQFFITLWREKDIGTILLFLAGALIYLRGHVKSEKLITHTKDIKTTDEMNALRSKMMSTLRVIESILYTGIESYVYDYPGGQDRRISVIRKSKPVDIKARDYLSEYHDALHRCVLESAPEILLNEMLVHRVAESAVNESQERTSATFLSNIICYDIAGHAGKNREIRLIEKRILPEESIISMYRELCVCARNLHEIKDSAIESEIQEHRIPFVPSIRKLLKGRKKSKKRQKH